MLGIQSAVLIIISIMLVIVSSWNLSIFVRLNGVSPQYDNDKVFDYACNVSKKYVKFGKIVSIIMLVISVILLIISSINVYYTYTHTHDK